ncbi:MAG: SDR family NAD(P)-dependent oxidoreductase [Gemmatimonadales bacterium]
MGSLEGKVALVTGSSRGIGAAIARLFARQGAAVAVHGRDVAAVSTVRDDILRAGGRAIDVVGDVTKLGDVEAIRQAVEDSLGPVDVLVANAGGSLTPPRLALEDIDEAGWRRSVDANLTATFLTLKCFLPGMKARRRGAIITMSSAAARRPTAFSPIPYAAAKAGIQLLTQEVAVQAGPYGVRANCIAPETIVTERIDTLMSAAVRDQLIAEHPSRRLGTPEDVAQAALYLASDASAWVSGAVLDVAGASVLR